jgi:hypothetical protein
VMGIALTGHLLLKLVRKRGLEPLSLSALAPKAIFARFGGHCGNLSGFLLNGAGIVVFRGFS